MNEDLTPGGCIVAVDAYYGSGVSVTYTWMSIAMHLAVVSYHSYDMLAIYVPMRGLHQHCIGGI